MGSNFIILSGISFIVSAIFSIFFIPYLIKWCTKRKVLAEDMNKIDHLKHAKIARLGGLGGFFVFIISILITLIIRSIFGLVSINLNYLYPMLLSITIAAFAGFVDDLLIFIHRPIKPILGLFAAIPMMSIAYEKTSLYIHIPFIGKIYIGLFFVLLVTPLLIAFTINAFNIMADFDGLASGNGIIITLTLILIFASANAATSLFILIALLPILVVLHFYNRFPAKLFLGNSGTLFIGAVFGVAAITANKELSVIILFIPYFFHFILQVRYAFDMKGALVRPRERAIPQKDGTIKSEYKKAYGLTHLLMQRIPNMTELKLANSIYLIEIFFAIIALLVQFPNFVKLFIH